MSRVSDILLSEAAMLARGHERQGQIYGALAENLGQIPGQVVQLHNQQIQQQNQQQEQQLRMQEQQNRNTLTGLQVRGAQRAEAEQNNFDKILGSGVIRPDGTMNFEMASQAALQSGMPHQIVKIRELSDALDKSAREREAWHRDQLGILAARVDPTDVGSYDALVTSQGAAGAIDKDTANRLLTIEDPAAIKAQLDQWMGQSPTVLAQRKAGERSVARGANIVDLNQIDPGTGQAKVLATGQAPAVTSAELAQKAAGGDPAAAKAVALLHPAATESTPEKQYLEALTNGDTERAKNILTAIRQTVQAKQDPAAAATARELAGLRVEEARARLADLNSDVGLGAETQMTATGHQYVNLSKYKGKDYQKAQRQAHEQGIFGASAAETDALQNIDTARQNMKLIEANVGKLPRSATTRTLGAGLINKAEAYLQLDPELASWGTYRTAAIQAMRALAGSKGLRINKSEIEASMANDIPEITDTQATARKKMASVERMLQSQENGIFGTSSAPAAPATGGGTKIGRFDVTVGP